LPAATRLAGVGVFVVTGLLLFGIGLFMIGDRQMAFAKKFTIYTQFARITGLQPGAIVRVAGAKGGSVTDIAPPGTPSDKFRVQLEITENLHQLVRTDSVASIETEGLVGGTFLAVGTGTDRAPIAPPLSTIAGKEPFGFADLLLQMSDAVTRVNATIDMIQDELGTTLQSIGQTVDNANDLIEAVTKDVTVIASAGARISRDAAEIARAMRNGQGLLGKLLTDDTLYERVTNVAAQAEEIASNARDVIEQARKALNDFQTSNGGMSSNLRQTLDQARAAMTSFSDNMEALKHNFLFRGFFNDRGYFNLAGLSPAQYRSGVLTRDNRRAVARVWLKAALVFEPDPAAPAAERLTVDGRARVDSAVAPFLDRLASGVLVVEGYAMQGTRDEQYVRSRARAEIVREYLIGKFSLDPATTGLMPLGIDAPDSPDNGQWDGVALAAFLERQEPTTGKTTGKK
jgi:phospholipid/cholesterol/gamma-HCH transport system substrate-binding protein